MEPWAYSDIYRVKGGCWLPRQFRSLWPQMLSPPFSEREVMSPLTVKPTWHWETRLWEASTIPIYWAFPYEVLHKLTISKNMVHSKVVFKQFQMLCPHFVGDSWSQMARSQACCHSKNFVFVDMFYILGFSCSKLILMDIMPLTKLKSMEILQC